MVIVKLTGGYAIGRFLYGDYADSCLKFVEIVESLAASLAGEPVLPLMFFLVLHTLRLARPGLPGEIFEFVFLLGQELQQPYSYDAKNHPHVRFYILILWQSFNTEKDLFGEDSNFGWHLNFKLGSFVFSIQIWESLASHTWYAWPLSMFALFSVTEESNF